MSTPDNVTSLAKHRPMQYRGWHELSLAERDVYVQGYCAGYGAGWQAADEDADLVHREAYRIVQRMAGLPARDAEADRAAAQRRADRFGQPTFGGPR